MKNLLPMKNLIFSKKYLKTKLWFGTLIATILYHYLNKDKSLYDAMKQGGNSELKNDNEKNEDLSGFTSEDEYIAETIADESPYDENAAIIPSEWILEYWNSIRNRKPAINVPKLSKGIISDSKIRKCDISEFLDSQIVQDVYKLFKNKKYFDETGFRTGALAWDAGQYFYLPVDVIKSSVDNVSDFSKKLTVNATEIAQSGWVGLKNGISYLYNGFMRKFTTSEGTETIVEQDIDNNTMPNPFQNTIVEQDRDNNTMPNPFQNTIVEQDQNNNAILDHTQNTIVEQDRNNNAMLNATLNDENILEQVNGGFMINLKMFLATSYENMKTKMHQMSAFFSSKILRNVSNTSPGAADPPVNG